MKETIRTASVVEIYNEAIKEFEAERKSLVVEKTTLQGRTVAKKTGGCLSVLFGIVLLLSGILFVVAGAGIEEAGMVIVGVMLMIFSLLIFANSNPEAKHAKRIKEINDRIAELDEEIDKRKTKKKSLLEAEEIIVSKDMKAEKETISPERMTVPNENQEPLEKVCPMCAETVKAAAKICRYCRYDFTTEGD